MGVLQKAYTFVKKHWSTDDDVYPDDLNRYEDGIEELYNRATEQDKQINVLSTERGYLNSKEITGVSIRTLTKNGTYAIDTNTCTDIPITNQGWAYLTVKANNDSYLIHELSYLNIPNATFKYKCLGGVWGEYENFATTTKTDILVTPTNGLKVTGNNVSFVEEIAGIKIYHGELEAAAPISDNPIVLTLPKFTSNTWRPVTFVKQDTKEAYGGWCYHGGQVRASLPAGKYNIDIIYT